MKRYRGLILSRASCDSISDLKGLQGPRYVQGAQGDATRIQNASKTHQQHSVPETGDIWCENFSILRSAPQDIRSQKARPSAVSLDLSPGNVEGKMTYRWVHYRHKTRLMTHIIGVTFSTCVARLARTCTAVKKQLM